jgi:uncharacterized protein YjdB
VMYIAGDEPEGEWDTFLKIRRFDNWSAGNRTPSFTATLPYNDSQYTPETSYGAGTPNSFTVAGDYMFVLYGYGHIRILDKSDGSLVGTLVQDVANGWHGSGGQVDAPYSLTAYKRLTGEYVFFFENAAWANIMMQRWCPDGTCSETLTPVQGVIISPDTLDVFGTGTGTLSSEFIPANASNKAINWISSDPMIATVKGAANGKCTVTGVKVGTCMVIGTTKDGLKSDTAIVVVNSLAVTGISVTPEQLLLGVNRTKQLSAELSPATATNKNVNWQSSDSTIVKVNSTGMVTGVAFGLAQVRGISDDGHLMDSCAVTVDVTGDGLKGEYYNTNDFTGEIALSRIDPFIDFSYGDGSYAPDQPTDHYSVRWTGQVVPLYSETYTFETSCDDGSRLWVNGKQLVNNWIVQGENPKTGTITLTEGVKYNIKMEYYENDGGAAARLRWSSPSQTYEIIPQEQLYSTYTIIPVAGMSIAPDSVNLNIGANTTLVATFVPDNATNQEIKWKSSDISVANVDSKGRIKAIAPGQAMITATSVEGSFTDSTKVVVQNAVAPLSPPLISLNFNDGTGTVAANTGSLPATFALSAEVPTWSANVPTGGGSNSVDFGTTTGNYVVESNDIVEGLKNLDAFTITGWVNCRSSEEGGGGNRIVSWINDGGDGVDLVYHSDGSIQMGINQWSDNENPPRSSAGKVTTDPDANAANWVFFAVTYDSKIQDVSYYFGNNTTDATLDNSTTYDRGSVGTGISKLAIGHFDVATREWALDRMFRGLIDEVNVFGEVLTQDQIVKIQKPVVITPLISLNFNEGTGTVAANTGSLPATFSLTADVPAWSNNVSAGGGLNSVDFGTTTGNYVVESDDVVEGLKSLDAFTITGWVNCRSSEEGGGGNRIVSWINDGGDGVDLVYHSDGSLQMGINQWSDNENPPRSSADKITTDPDANASNWVFFAVTYDSKIQDVSYYFGNNSTNATLDNSTTYDRGAVGTGISKLAIGHFDVATREWATDRMFRGLMDEIKIIGVALDAEQIVKIQKEVYTGISIPTSNNVILYPNPVKDRLFLSLNADRIIVTDIHGREVLRTRGTSVDVSILKQGVYIVKYFVGQKVSTSKIIKQ